MRGIVLKIKLQDYSGNRTLYKNECDITNKQTLIMMFSNLLPFGIDIRKLAIELDKFEARDALREVEKRLEEEGWFG